MLQDPNVERVIKNYTEPLQKQISMMQIELDVLKKQCNIGAVSGMLPLTENAKEKLKYINGSCIARYFPKEQPTKEWAGAVLDLLEELGLGNYR